MKALRNYLTESNNKKDKALKKCEELFSKALKLRKYLLQALRFTYFDSPDKLQKFKAISKVKGNWEQEEHGDRILCCIHMYTASNQNFFKSCHSRFYLINAHIGIMGKVCPVVNRNAQNQLLIITLKLILS